MAIGATKSKAGIIPESAPVVVSGSSRGVWIQGVNSDARTAQGTTTKLCSPLAITDSTFTWLPLAVGVTRVQVRARVPKATTAVGTSPLIALFALWRTDPNSTIDPSAAVADEFQFERLDAATLTATGSSLTFPASPTTSNCRYDATWFYSSMLSTSPFNPTDMNGAHYLGIVVTVAGACTASAAMPIDVLVMN